MKFKAVLWVLILVFAPISVYAYDLADIKAELSSILQRVLILQEQLAAIISSSNNSLNSNTSVSLPGSTIDCNLASVKDLQLHDVSPSVREMQKILNLSSDTSISSLGDGAPGNESTYFGILTYKAVVKFQKKYNISPAGGFVGPATRTKLKEVCLNYNSNLRVATASSVPVAPTSSPTPQPAPVAVNPTPQPIPTPQPNPNPISNSSIQWGAYAGDSPSDLGELETLVGKEANIQAIFLGFSDSISSQYKTTLGLKGKTLMIFWEPSFGYDTINNGSQDSVIKKFAAAVKSYGYPVIMAPFNEMNLNAEDWGYSVHGNTAAKFKKSWIKIHDIFVQEGAGNAKFMLVYNNDSIPDQSGNKFSDYYPGDDYIDYIGIDGFNFGSPWQSFSSVFDDAFARVSSYNKPTFISALASASGSQKASWITEGLGSKVKNYQNFAGWIWFNQNKEQNWLINSDPAALSAFKSVLP